MLWEREGRGLLGHRPSLSVTDPGIRGSHLLLPLLIQGGTPF